MEQKGLSNVDIKGRLRQIALFIGILLVGVLISYAVDAFR
jgi:hypothetical protein